MDAREIITSRKLRAGGIDARAIINSKRKEREHTYQQPSSRREEVSHQTPLKPNQDKFDEGGPSHAPFVFKTALSPEFWPLLTGVGQDSQHGDL